MVGIHYGTLQRLKNDDNLVLITPDKGYGVILINKSG